jgi:integrase
MEGYPVVPLSHKPHRSQVKHPGRSSSPPILSSRILGFAGFGPAPQLRKTNPTDHRIAAQANAHLPEAEKIDVSPHVLRHTFLRKLAETKGVHYAREASGHQSDRYIRRYVKPDRQTLAEAIDELE